MKKLVIILSILLAAPLVAHAQHVNVGTLDEDTNVVTVTTGAEHGLMFGAGYARVVAVADRPIVLGGDLTIGFAEVDVDDYRLRASALAPIVGGGRWKLLGAVMATVRGTENDVGQLTNVSADAAILAGRYVPRWFVAAELGFNWAIATHVAHSDAYRMTVYADAEDGWYGTPGGMVRGGVQGGVSFGRHDVILRVGRLLDVSGAAPMFPFYGTLTFDTRW